MSNLDDLFRERNRLELAVLYKIKTGFEEAETEKYLEKYSIIQEKINLELRKRHGDKKYFR